jgi:hypothetical protein
MRAYYLLIGSLFLSVAWADEAEDLLRPLIPHDINPAEDEVVLLSSIHGMGDFINLSNEPDKQSSVGYCLGITEAQSALFTSVNFDNSKPHDSEDEIYKKLKDAMNSNDRKTVTIYGFKNRAEFIAAQTKALKKVIAEYQNSHSVQVTQNGQAMRVEGEPGETKSKENLVADIKRAGDLAQQLQNRILAQKPTTLALFQMADDKISNEPGHAVTVVGYVKKKGAAEPDRFLVVDPNFPRKLKVMRREGAGWSAELPPHPGAVVRPTHVVASELKAPDSDALDQKLAENFRVTKPELHYAPIRKVCAPSSSAAIFERAASKAD